MNTKTSSFALNTYDLQLMDLAFIEDLGLPYRDITSEILFTDSHIISTAKIISKHPEPITICGLKILDAIFAKMDIEWVSAHADGMSLTTGETLLTLTGRAEHLLMCERITLNFLQRLCAIATKTQQFVQAIQHTSTKILDTRKTLPGFRHLEKYAVFCGGGVNHRFGLYDAIMIKDTHADFLGGIDKSLDRLPENILENFPVIIEVQNIEELTIVLQNKHKVSRVLLDNMSLAQIKTCVLLAKNLLALEVSGNIHLGNVVEIAETGVDFISVGKITHSAGSVDLSMKCELSS